MSILARINFKLNKWKTDLYLKKNRNLLVNKDFTVISNNCWGGILYKDFGLPYLSPTVNMYFFIPCYIKFLENLNYYLGLELKFIKESKYKQANDNLKIKKYPIGLLGDIEIHFIHYEDEALTYKAWNDRVKRVNLQNLFVAMSERDLCTPEHIKIFDNLPYKNKVCFTAKDYPFESTIKIEKFSENGEVGSPDLIMGSTYEKLNIVNWLNNGKG